MNGYVIGGYVLAIGSLSSYGVSLVARERAARRRRPPIPSPTDGVAASETHAEWGVAGEGS